MSISLMKYIRSNALHIIVIIATLAFSLWIWWPTRILPYHWDSAGFVINATRDLAAQNFNPWIAEHSDFAHPPLVMTLVGLTWIVLGDTQLNAHISMFIFLPILMTGTYFITRKLSQINTDDQTQVVIESIGASVIVGSLPFVIAEYGLIYIDLPAGALATLAIACFLYRHFVIGALILTCAAFSKESALLVLPGLLIYNAVHYYQSEGQQFWKNKSYHIQTALTLAPAIIFAIWLLYHQLITGWLLVRPGRQMPQLTFNQRAQSLYTIFSRLHFEQNRWIYTIPAVLGLSITSFNPKLRLNILSNPIMIGCLSIIGTGLLAYAIQGEFALRYGILFTGVLVAVWLRMTRQLVTVITEKFTVWITFAIVILAFFANFNAWYPPAVFASTFDFSPDEDLSYIHMIKLGVDAANYLAVNYPDAKIFGAFPENYQLTQTYQGYTKEPRDFSLCNEFEYQPDRINIVYLHPYSPIQLDCQKIRQTHNLVPLPKYRFENGSKWLELYQIVPSEDLEQVLDK